MAENSLGSIISDIFNAQNWTQAYKILLETHEPLS